jgi:glutathione S-transferase
MYPFTALVTCLAIAFYFFTSIQVSKARVAFGIKVPAITGNPDFEQVFRVQINTLEWMPIFLPSLWPSLPCWAWSGSPAASST